MIRDWLCNEALRKPSAEAGTIARAPEFYQALDSVFDEAAAARMFREDAERMPELRAWLDERFTGNITYDDVANSKPGTLGFEIKALLDGGMKLYFGRLGPAENDFEFIRKRRAQTHDMEHIITGFPASSIAGEVALSLANITAAYGYYQPDLAKEASLTSMFYVSSWIMRTTLHAPQIMPAVLNAMERGVQMGKSLRRPMYMEKWEDYLDWQLTDIRAKFKLPEPTGFEGYWQWSEADMLPRAA